LENGVIQFENVGLRYGLGAEILRDLSFKITPHSFQFLSGPSGAGKTSLLRLLFVAMRPTRGLITLFDHNTATLSKDSLAVLRRRIGIVFQDFRLLDHLTTFDNVALPLKVLGRKEKSYHGEVTELLDWEPENESTFVERLMDARGSREVGICLRGVFLALDGDESGAGGGH
jgi:cell division transport system ATP-binding protein